MTPKEVLALIREKEVKAIDLRFMDFPGLWQHFTIPAETLTENTFEEGLGFDGSSIRGWQAINESDMLVLPQPETAFLDPFCKDVTLTMICNIQDPLTKEDYSRDPRNVARKAVNYMKSTGIADVAYFGPELEFFVFDDVRYDQNQHSGYYFIDSVEGAWNTGRDEKPNLGYKLRYKEGYFPVPPADALHDIRSEMMLTMIAVRPEDRGPASRGGHRRPGRDRHAVRPAGRDGRQRPEVQVHRQERGPQAQQDGHVHAQAALHGQRHRHARPFLAVEGRREPLCRLGLRRAVGHGPVRHRRPAPARPGPVRHHQPDDQQLQAAGARLRGAGQPGLQPAQPLGVDPHSGLFAQPEGQAAGVPLSGRLEQSVPGLLRDADGHARRHQATRSSRASRSTRTSTIWSRKNWPRCPKTPGSLEEALHNLEKDHEFLLQGDVFTQDVISTWIWYKREREVDAIRLRPHPYEFHMYFDI